MKGTFLNYGIEGFGKKYSVGMAVVKTLMKDIQRQEKWKGSKGQDAQPRTDLSPL